MKPLTHLGGDFQDGSETADARSLPRNTILIGDVRDRLCELPGSSVDTIITSPPYFGVRDYGHTQQLGVEPDVDGWVNGLRLVARELAGTSGGWIMRSRALAWQEAHWTV
jgi:DNA modification methylase